ncbi:MAG: methyltransferase domain-containing protein [Gammaproteobacteria bacterium]|nr:methyltransferase domain-containing protein [Gammaproteobacteria bacterium]
MTASLRGCPVCSHTEANDIWNQKYCLDEGSPLPGNTTIASCSACGFVFARSHARASDYRKYYAEATKYESSLNASGSGDTILDQKRIASLVDELTDGVPKDQAILDIGAAKGGVLVEFKRRGYTNLYGIDPSPACVEAIRARGIEACVATLEDSEWDLDPRVCDLIILSHVLEHVYDMRECTKAATKRLSATGKLYIEVPDASQYSVDGFPPFYFFDPEHINHCDLDAIKMLGFHTGLSVIKSHQKYLDVGATSSYPALGVWLGLQKEPADQSPSIRTADKIRTYVHQSSEVSTKMPYNKFLRDLVHHQTPVIIWGAGSHGRRMLANSLLAQANLIGIIDNDAGKQGKTIGNVMVYPDQAGMRMAMEQGATMVVAIALNAATVVDQIRRSAPQLEIIIV